MRAGKGNTAMVRTLNAARERKRIGRMIDGVRRDERAAIVAWLRNVADRNDAAGLDAAGAAIRVLADAIERADHTPKEQRHEQ